jgi:hypothetical protein
LALEESPHDQDQLEEKDGVSFIYDNIVATQAGDVIIDFHLAPQRGFSIRTNGPGADCCGSCDAGC